MGYADVHFAVKDTSDTIESIVMVILYALAAMLLILAVTLWGFWRLASWSWQAVQARHSHEEVTP